MAKATARQLSKQIGLLSGSVTYSGGIISTTTISGEGWVRVPQTDETNRPCFVNRQYIDLAGLTAQELTVFYQSFDIQKDKMPVSLTAARIFEYDIVSTRKLQDSELAEMTTSPPSFLPNTLDLMECTFGLRTSYALNTTIAFTFVKMSEDTFGAGRPNAMDKLHWTRVILLEPPIADPPSMDVSVYPTNLLVQTITAEEPDLVWMERLRRSYVLQGEV